MAQVRLILPNKECCYRLLITTCDKQDKVLFAFLCSGTVNEVLDMIEWTSNEFALQREGVVGVGNWQDLIARSQLWQDLDEWRLSDSPITSRGKHAAVALKRIVAETPRDYRIKTDQRQ